MRRQRSGKLPVLWSSGLSSKAPFLFNSLSGLSPPMLTSGPKKKDLVPSILFFSPLNVLISGCREVSHGPNRPGVRSTRLYHLTLLAKLLGMFSMHLHYQTVSFKPIEQWWESPDANLPSPSHQLGSFSQCKICTMNPDNHVKCYET